jgi:DNA-binding NtrC family response regulator
MIVVEADNDLADCVLDYFGGRYDVTRVATLEIASRELRSGTVDVLFADIDPGAPADTAVIEALRRNHPDLKIIVTYLAPSHEEGWKARVSGSASLLVRKPYSVLEIDRALESNGGRSGGHC